MMEEPPATESVSFDMSFIVSDDFSFKVPRITTYISLADFGQ